VATGGSVAPSGQRVFVASVGQMFIAGRHSGADAGIVVGGDDVLSAWKGDYPRMARVKLDERWVAFRKCVWDCADPDGSNPLSRRLP